VQAWAVGQLGKSGNLGATEQMLKQCVKPQWKRAPPARALRRPAKRVAGSRRELRIGVHSGDDVKLDGVAAAVCSRDRFIRIDERCSNTKGWWAALQHRYESL